MAAAHPLASSGLAARTRLTAKQVLDLAADVGPRTAGQNAIGGHHVVLTSRGTGVVELAINGRGDLVTVMKYRVTATDRPDGGSDCRVAMTSYRTQQSTFLMIPLGPKEMIGYKTYRAFLENLSAALKQADPSCGCTIS